MAFIQIIDFRTSKIDEGRKLVEEYRAKTQGKRTANRGILCQDRDEPNRYLNLVFFDSYEAAMENSNLPGTSESAEKMAAVLTAPPVFRDLDVLQDKDN